MKRATIPALVVVVGVLLLADLLLVNESVSELAALAIDAAILVAAGAALAAVGSLAVRRARDLWRRLHPDADIPPRLDFRMHDA